MILNCSTSRFLALLMFIKVVACSDITYQVFGHVTGMLPAAFGDFNSDELTDVFVLHNERKTVQVLLAVEEEPLLRPEHDLLCTFEKHRITSVVPGDFDGDAFMDILVTTQDIDRRSSDSFVYIFWGGLNHLNCSSESDPTLVIRGQPLAIDYNQDMIIDLFGLDKHGNRTFWIFDNNRTTPLSKPMRPNHGAHLRSPHSHAYLDLNNDCLADLFLTTEKNFEIWYGNEQTQDFDFSHTIELPEEAALIGQSVFMDVELIGKMDLITPMCFDSKCANSSILVFNNGQWHNLQVNFKDPDNNVWKFVLPDGHAYTDTITLRSGDFNMDGYPDILATLAITPDKPQAFLLENVPCESNCGGFTRTFAIRWKALSPFMNGTVMAVFYDFYQDGILDVIIVQINKSTGQQYTVGAFRNSLDYDANFIKVMVLTGLTNKLNPTIVGRLGKKKRTYGTNLPGPRISYHTTTQEGNPRHAMSAQLPQSAYFSLDLPYSIFGLGRTPNFVDTLTVGLSNRSRSWTQIIPNSQMVVIPWPPGQPSKWRAQLFVTPSKLILMSVAALTGVCGLITVIIGVLYWRERQEDKKERLQESHRFHFDAM